MEALSVTESQVANGGTDDTTEEHAGEREHDVGVEGDGVDAGLDAEVPPAEGGASEGGGEEAVAAEDLEVGRVTEANVEEVGVVLDEIDRSNSEGKLVISLLNSVGVGLLVTVVVAIVTHIY